MNCSSNNSDEEQIAEDEKENLEDDVVRGNTISTTASIANSS